MATPAARVSAAPRPVAVVDDDAAAAACAGCWVTNEGEGESPEVVVAESCLSFDGSDEGDDLNAEVGEVEEGGGEESEDEEEATVLEVGVAEVLRCS